MLKILFPISDFLYLLQLEEYETKRYFRTIRRFFWRRNLQKRGKLVYTKRAKITMYLALLPSVILFPLTPIWVGLANWILSPYFERAKLRLQKRAANFFRRQNKQTRVIAIAGSYGKTTTKNYIYELVKYNYKTQMIPENINTPTGIANWVINNFDPTSELLILEVDAYFVGEIKRSLTITPPDIAILTNIGDQHLERLGSKANIKKALMEVFDCAKPDAVKISKTTKETDDFALDYALQVAKLVKIPNDIVKDTIAKLKKPDRRGDVKTINGFTVIDESYNINLDSAENNLEKAEKMAKKDKRNLIVITAGIPELGKENGDNNKKLGKLLSAKANKIILLKSILCKDITDNSDKFILAKDLSESWKILENYDPKKYLILLLPELTDLYY